MEEVEGNVTPLYDAQLNVTNGTWYNGAGGSLVEEDLDYVTTHPVFSVLYLTFVSCSTLVGMIGNILVIAAVLGQPRLKTKANVFIVNLALSDACVTYVVQVFGIIGVTEGYGFFRERRWICQIVGSVCFISCPCSLWNMAIIAFNRYICICRRNLQEKIFGSWKKCVFIALLLWVACIVSEIPNHFLAGGHMFDPKLMMCFYDRDTHYVATIFFIAVTLCPPLIVVVVCYWMILSTVKASRKRVQKFSQIERDREAKLEGWTQSEVRLAQTFAVVFAVFLLCWTPYAVVAIFDSNDHWPQIVYMVVLQLAHTNSSLNAIIYAATSRDFRRGYLAMLPGCIKPAEVETTAKQSLPGSRGKANPISKTDDDL